ncbi:MAG: hypothetical protein E7329_07955 [Clostridiales bacterium]|nr:hypothetical protein [Clostridiales bacterium]
MVSWAGIPKKRRGDPHAQEAVQSSLLPAPHGPAHPGAADQCYCDGHVRGIF